jgi:hypothetical protein
MKIQVTMLSSDVSTVVEVVDLKPKARKRHSYEITLPDSIQAKHIPPARLGYYGHTEYILDEENTLIVGRFYDETLASIAKKSKGQRL